MILIFVANLDVGLIFHRDSVDRGRTSAVLVGITEGWEGRLERDFEEFCEDTYADSGG